MTRSAQSSNVGRVLYVCFGVWQYKHFFVWSCCSLISISVLNQLDFFYNYVMYILLEINMTTSSIIIKINTYVYRFNFYVVVEFNFLFSSFLKK